MKVTGIIPARYASTRFPGKPLAKICGKPMIQHVYEKAKQAKQVDTVMVATDDIRIYDAVTEFGGIAIMTSEDHKSGTDRIAEAVWGSDVDIVVNIQGDEPMIDPIIIDEAVVPVKYDIRIDMCTVMTPITSVMELKNPGVVKVVVDKDGYALYFSRCPIPFVRDIKGAAPHFKHIGLYVYKRDFLLKYASLPQTPLERAESLEQLRALENGYKIKVVKVDYSPISVDTPEDLAEVEKLMRNIKDEG